MSWSLWVLDTEKVGSKDCVIFPMFSWLYPKSLNKELHVAQSSLVCWGQDSDVLCILECLYFTSLMAWNWAWGLWQRENQIDIFMFLFCFIFYAFSCTCMCSNRPGPSWRASLDLLTMCWLISIWANKPHFPYCLNRKKNETKRSTWLPLILASSWVCSMSTSCLFLGYDSSSEIKIPIGVNSYGIYWFFMRVKWMNFWSVSGQPDTECSRHFVSVEPSI